MRWLRVLLLVAAGTALFFGGELWASALQPDSIVLVRPSPLLPAPARPHLRAPRVVVPASPSVAAQLGINSGGGSLTRASATAGRKVATDASTAQAAGAAPPQSVGDSGATAQGAMTNGQHGSGESRPPRSPPHHGPPPRPPHHPPPRKPPPP